MKVLMTTGVAAVALATAVLAGPTEYTWVQGQTSYGDDMDVTYDDSGDIVSMTVKSADGLRLTGNASASFAAGARITSLSWGGVEFDVPLAGKGGAEFCSRQYRGDYDANVTTRKFLPDAESNQVVIAHNYDLSKFAVIGAQYNPYNRGANYIYSSTTGAAYHVSCGAGPADGDTNRNYTYHYSCQIQGVDFASGKTHYVRCVFLEVRQLGDDLVAWTPTAYVSDNLTDLGKDFTPGFAWKMGISCDSPYCGGYGIAKIAFDSTDDREFLVKAKKSVDLQGTISVGSRVMFRADGSSALTAGDAWGGSVKVNGKFVLANRGGITLNGNMEYGTYGKTEIVADASRPATWPAEVSLPDYVATEWCDLGCDFPIGAVSDVIGTAGGGMIFGNPKPTYVARNWQRPTATNITCHLFCADPNYFVKGLLFEIWQSGSGTRCRVIKAAYSKQYTTLAAAQAAIETADVNRMSENSVATGPSTGAYGLINAKIVLGGAKPYYRMDVDLNMTFSGSEQKFSVRGSDDESVLVRALKSASVPVVTVCTNAVFCDADSGSYPQETSNYRVERGGEFRQNSSWGFPATAYLDIAGGVFRVSPTNSLSGSTIWGLYLNNVTFEDGGRITDHAFHCGYYKNPVWKVRGNHPAEIEYGFTVNGNESKPNEKITVTFDVDDVTGDDDADMVIGGALKYIYDIRKNAGLRKCGAGTLRMTGVNTVTTYPFIIEGGLWQIAASGCVSANNDVQLAGGGISEAAGCTNTLGDITVDDNAKQFVKLADKSELTFTTFTAGSGSCVSVETASATARLRILETTDASLRRMRFNGLRAFRDEEGYVYGSKPGFILIVR